MDCLSEKDFRIKAIFKEFKQIADRLGFETISDMFYILYFEEQKSIDYLVNFLGFDRFVIKRRLKKLGKLRVGGSARYGKSKFLNQEKIEKIIAMKKDYLWKEIKEKLGLKCALGTLQFWEKEFIKRNFSMEGRVEDGIKGRI
jgi:hypothetical protein